MIAATKNANASDEKILELVRLKDKEGYDLFYKKYWKQLLGYTCLLVPDKHYAEEIVQSLFISLFTKGFSLKNDLNLHSYLHQAIRNRVANQYRDRYNYKKHIAKQPIILHTSPEQTMNALEIHDLRKELRRCLAKLPSKYTVVYLLNKDQQLTIKEIANRLERPEGTVEKQLRRVVKYLKQNLRIES